MRRFFLIKETTEHFEVEAENLEEVTDLLNRDGEGRYRTGQQEIYWSEELKPWP